jgi:hypothetical protein
MTPDREQRVSEIRGFPSQTSHTLSALSGGAFVVLYVVAFILTIDHPGYKDSPAKFAGWFTDNQSQLQIAALLSAFGLFWLVWFFGVLRWLYDGAERTARGFVRASPIAFAGAISGAALAAAAMMAEVTAIETVGAVPASVTRMLGLMHNYGLNWAAVLLSVFLLSSFFIIRVTQVLPQWLGLLAFLGTVVGFLQAVLFLSPSQGGHGIFGIARSAWFVIFLIYVLFSSISIARRIETSLLAG